MGVGKREWVLGAAGGDDGGGALAGSGGRLRRELETAGLVASSLKGLEEEVVVLRRRLRLD